MDREKDREKNRERKGKEKKKKNSTDEWGESGRTKMDRKPERERESEGGAALQGFCIIAKGRVMSLLKKRKFLSLPCM